MDTKAMSMADRAMNRIKTNKHMRVSVMSMNHVNMKNHENGNCDFEKCDNESYEKERYERWQSVKRILLSVAVS